jgi:hypothetical protein
MSDENTQTILERLDRIEANQEIYIKISEGYQKASDRVANLAFTLVGATAVIAVISPAVKAITKYAIR